MKNTRKIRKIEETAREEKSEKLIYIIQWKKKDCSYASSSHEGKRFLQMKIPEKNSLPFITETDTCDTEE